MDWHSASSPAKSPYWLRSNYCTKRSSFRSLDWFSARRVLITALGRWTRTSYPLKMKGSRPETNSVARLFFWKKSKTTLNRNSHADSLRLNSMATLTMSCFSGGLRVLGNPILLSPRTRFVRTYIKSFFKLGKRSISRDCLRSETLWNPLTSPWKICKANVKCESHEISYCTFPKYSQCEWRITRSICLSFSKKMVRSALAIVLFRFCIFKSPRSSS